MKKLVAIGAMLALMMMAAVPAFANHNGAVAGDVDLRFVDASQTQAAAAWQTNEGDATAGNVASAAAIDQSLTIDQSQVNAGVGGVGAGNDIIVNDFFWWWF